MLGPPVDVRTEPAPVGAEEHCGVHVGGGFAVGEAHEGIEVLAHLFLVGVGDAEEHADGLHRHLGAEVGDEIEAAGIHERIERGDTERSDLRLDVEHPLRREHPAEQAAVQVVRRRILEQDVPRRHLDAALDRFQHRALARDVGLPVDEAPFDVGEAAQRVEVVLLVVIERALIAEATPDRVRIVVDLEVVGVVVHVRSFGRGFGRASACGAG